MRCQGFFRGMEFKPKPNQSERYGFTPRHPNKVRTSSIFPIGSSFSTVMNVKIEKRLTIVRSKSEAAILSHGDTVDMLAEAEREQLLLAMETMARKCKNGDVIFSEHRGSLRSLKRFHAHIIVEEDADFKLFIPEYNHHFLIRNEPQKRLTELKTWALKDYAECEQRIFRLALSDLPTIQPLHDGVQYDIHMGCSRIHLPLEPAENPLNTVYRYVHKYKLKNFHYGIVLAPGGTIRDVFIHIFPPDFIDHLVMQRGETLVFIQDYMQTFHDGIANNDLNAFLTT
jgi:hypothetical protein